MMTTLALLAVLQGPCLPDCPASKAHVQSLDHTHGKTCACGLKTDVCFALCRACAEAKGLCLGCGAKAVEPSRVWKRDAGPEPAAGIRLEGDVVAIERGRVLHSERASLAGLREFEDRIELTIAVRTPLCGSEPKVVDSLYIRLPKRPGKTIVIRQIRSSAVRSAPEKITVLAELKG